MPCVKGGPLVQGGPIQQGVIKRNLHIGLSIRSWEGKYHHMGFVSCLLYDRNLIETRDLFPYSSEMSVFGIMK